MKWTYIYAIIGLVTICFACSKDDAVTQTPPDDTPLIDGKLAFVKPFTTDFGIYFLDNDGIHVVKEDPDENRPAHLRWLNDGSSIVYAQGHDQGNGQGTYRDSIVIINSDGEWQATVVRGLEHFCGGLDWSPDGTMLAFDHSATKSLGIIDIDANSLKYFRYDSGSIESMDWSPDMRQIVLHIDNYYEGDGVYLFHVEEAIFERLTDLFFINFYVTPRWSPDGTSIVFEDSDEIFTMNPDGSNRRKIADGNFPVWSPDGTRIAYAFDTFMEVHGIYLINPDGTDNVLLYNTKDWLLYLDWK